MKNKIISVIIIVLLILIMIFIVGKLKYNNPTSKPEPTQSEKQEEFSK